MKRVKKFEGGTRLTTFRLPVNGYMEVRLAMNRVLNSFRESGENRKFDSEGIVSENVFVGSRTVQLEYVDPISNEQLVKEQEFLDLQPEKLVINTTGSLGAIVNPKTKLYIKKGIAIAEENKFLTKAKKMVELPDAKIETMFPCGCYYDGLYRKKTGCTFGTLEEHRIKFPKA